jgi:nitrogen regulatory protein PII-like uncharacterized protein
MSDLSALAERVAKARTILPEDVIAARRAVYREDGAIDATELDRLFAIDEMAETVCEDWIAFFAEAVSDHLVHQSAPQGYVDAANARWLMARIDRDGAVKSATELEALVKVLEVATQAPADLASYAMTQVAAAVIDGAGPLARGRTLEPGRIGRDEVELLRRILFAAGGENSLAISRAEADILFDLNDRTAGLDNDPAWPDLFVKAIANFMLAASGYQPPAREIALKREAWLDEPSQGVTGFFARLFEGGLSWMLDEYRKSASLSERAAETINQRREEAVAWSAIVTDDEAQWLAERIGRDGDVTANEKALLTFMRSEGPEIHPRLKALLAKAA